MTFRRTDHPEWLDGLKAGDPVAIQWRGSYCDLRTVERTTKTLLFVNSRKFRRSDGREIPKYGSSGDRLIPVTDEIRDQLEAENLRWEYRHAMKELPDALRTGELTILRHAVESLRSVAKAIGCKTIDD